MKVTYLEEFVEIAATLNYTRVAKKRHTSPSVLSKHVASIEHELGIKLFNRKSTGISLTPAGSRFLEDILPVIEKYHYALGNVRTSKALAKKQLCIGLDTRNPSLVKAIAQASAFLKETSLISVNYSLPTYKGYFESLYSQNIDAVVTFRSSKIPDNILSTDLLKEHWAAIVPNDHPLANRKTISLVHDLSVYTIIRLKGTFFRPGFDVIEDAFEKYGVTPVSRFSMISSLDELSLMSDFSDVLILPSSSLCKLSFLSPETHSVLSFEEELSFDSVILSLRQKTSDHLTLFIKELKSRLH